jgi:hypothetical protein
LLLRKGSRRSNIRIACIDDHSLPRAVGMPCSFRPSAIALRLVFPAACSSLMIGATSGSLRVSTRPQASTFAMAVATDCSRVTLVRRDACGPLQPPTIRRLHAVVLLLGSARDRAEREEMRIGPRPATFERWTAEDEALLQTMLDAKTDLDLIARKLKRSRPAIHKRINVLRKKRAFS